RDATPEPAGCRGRGPPRPHRVAGLLHHPGAARLAARDDARQPHRQSGAPGDQLALRLRPRHATPRLHPADLPRVLPHLRDGAAVGAGVKVLAHLSGWLVLLFLLAPLLSLSPLPPASA